LFYYVFVECDIKLRFVLFCLIGFSHVSSIAAGNADVPVIDNGFCYGRASGMAPRARIAVYKAIFPSVGTLADVVAAIDQVSFHSVQATQITY
jgi:hypothetical protein